jgi:tetratricopeptide (TPR) repeat protein
MTLLIIILAVGFPVAAIFSWVFDITPMGIQKTRPSAEKKKQRSDIEIRKWKNTTLISFVVIVVLVLYNIVNATLVGNNKGNNDKSITIQPFDCLSNENDLNLKGAIYTEYINGTLTSIEDITLRTWPPYLNFKENKKSYPELGRELNVAFILKGTLSKLTDNIILIVQLIRTKTESIAWAQNYVLDPENSNFFEIQRDITLNVTSSLNAGLSRREKFRINKRPSINPSAMKSFIQGNAVSQRIIFNTSSGNRFFTQMIDDNLFADAVSSFDKAIEQDPAFALAYAKRAIIRSWGYHTRHIDKSAIQECKSDIEKAIELDPELVENLIAQGFYFYYCINDYNRALGYFTRASKELPNNWQCIYYMALVQRVLGNWEKSQELMANVLEFNPQDPLLLTNIGISEEMMRNYDKALYYHDRAIEIMPKWPSAYMNKITTILLQNGSTEEARKIIDTASRKTDNKFKELRIRINIYEGRLQEALHEIELSEPADFEDRGQQLLLYAEIYRYLNNQQASETFARSALSFYENKITDEPEKCENYSLMGISYAGLNNKTYAIEYGENAAKMSKDNYMWYTGRRHDLAVIYVMTGEYDKCLKELEFLLGKPSMVSVKLLQIDPIWNPVRETSGFRNIIAKYSVKNP